MLKFYIFVKINTEREKHCECHLAAVDKVIALLVTQWCLTLHDPMDYSLLGSSAHEILQAIVLEWVAIPFSRGSSGLGTEPKSPALQEDSLLSPENPSY